MKNSEVREKIKLVNSLNTDEERVAFCKYARKVPDNGTIVDIGTCAGSSAFCFAFGSKPSVKVHTIDPLDNEKFFIMRKFFGLEKKVLYIKKTSEDAVKDFDQKIDLLLIDGIHTYDGVTNDFNWFRPFMKKDSVIMFHDYYLYRNAIGRAVNELEEKGLIEKIEIIDSLYQEEIRTGLYIAKVK